ncbi:MAG: hypothetical protein ACI37R_01780 [Candidatus Avigastranaerophilus sp.]
MQENLINTKMKEIYYFNPCIAEENQETESSKELWKLMNIYAQQNYNNIKAAC